MKLCSFSTSLLVSLEKKLNPVTGRFGFGVNDADNPKTVLSTDKGGVMVVLL